MFFIAENWVTGRVDIGEMLDEIYKEMSELLRKQVHGVMKMKKKKNDGPPKKFFWEEG